MNDAHGFPEHDVESGRGSVRSRLLVLAVESLNQALITHDEFLSAMSLVDLGEDQRVALLSQASSERQDGNAE